MKFWLLAVCTLLSGTTGFGKSTQNMEFSGAVAHGDHGDAPLLLYFRASNCEACEILDPLFESAKNKARLEQYYVPVCLSLDESDGKACAEIYQVSSAPALVIADRKGNVLFRSSSQSQEEIMQFIENLPTPLAVPVSEQYASEDLSTVHSGLAVVKHRARIDISPLALSPPAPIHRAPDPLHQVAAVPMLTRPPVISADEHSVQALPVVHRTPGLPVQEAHAGSAGVDAPARAKTASKRRWQYAIQLGYFTAETYASKMVRKASQQGLPEARWVDGERDGQKFFRVLVGNYTTLFEAQRQLEFVSSIGFKAAIYRW